MNWLYATQYILLVFNDAHIRFFGQCERTLNRSLSTSSSSYNVANIGWVIMSQVPGVKYLFESEIRWFFNVTMSARFSAQRTNVTEKQKGYAKYSPLQIPRKEIF